MTGRYDPSAPQPNGAPPLTQVELTWLEGRTERWIRFGRSTGATIIDRWQRILTFPPDSVFAFVRWASNDFGTIVSRIDIVRAVDCGEAYQTLPCVCPGGDILLRISGWPKVERVLQTIDAVEALGIEAADAAPDHWRHVHNRLVAGEQPRPYDHGQHRAWLLRRRLASS
jgi:hypothetical protein